MPDIVVKQNGETVRVTVATGPRGPQGPAGPQGLPGPNSVPTDVAVAALVSTPGTDTEEALRGTFVAQGAPATIGAAWRFGIAPAIRGASGNAIVGKAVGDTNAGLFNIQHNGDLGYLFHLTSAASSTSNTALLGLGLDYGAASAILISQKSSGFGMSLIANPSASAEAMVDIVTYGPRAQRIRQKVGAQPWALVHDKGQGYSDGVTTNGSTTFTSATAAFVAGDVGKTLAQTTSRGEGFVIPSATTIVSVTNGTTVVLSAAATGSATGINFEVGGRVPSASQKYMEFFDSDGVTRGSVAPNLVQWVGANHEVRATGSNPARIFETPNEIRMYQYNAGGSNYWATYLQQSGGTFRIRSYAPAGAGSESVYTDMIRVIKDQIGFHGATPVSQPTITGSRAGNAALASLLTFLASRGDIIDGSSA